MSDAVTNKAICIAYWPGQDTAVCGTHLVQIMALASHMGFSLRTSPLFEPGEQPECGNCANKAGRQP